MSQKKQRLSNKDLEKVLESMRLWVKSYRDEVAKLVYHINSLTDDLEKAEARIRELSQADFFKQKEKLAIAEVKSEGLPIEKHPLPKRLALMMDTGIKGSPEWLNTLKWNALTEEKAAELIVVYYKTLDM